MHPFLFEIFDRQISTYGLFMIMGAVVAWLLIRFLSGSNAAQASYTRDIPLIFLICICGGLAGAFILRPLTRIPEIIMNWEHIRQMPLEVLFSYLFGEIVFYGGLIGGLIAMVLFCRGFNIPVLPAADLFAPALALAHGFGRIGCFFGGCCYGIAVNATHPLAVIYPPGPANAPVGVPILATPLIEAILLFILAAVLVIVYRKTVAAGKVPNGFAAILYGLLYSILRFVIEFYRGDIGRGVYGPFSTSQYISIAVFIVCAVLMLRIKTARSCSKT